MSKLSIPQNVLVNTALSQVGYKATNIKNNKYAKELDALGKVYNYPKNGFDWCDIFVDWCFIKTFGLTTGLKMLYQPEKSTGAGCKFSAQFYRSNNSWSNTPSVGAQIFFGTFGNESHTGIVVGTDSKNVYTVEGNTGGGNGAVNKRTYARSNLRIVGYGIPKWSLVKQTKKSNSTIAQEVIAGKWGNGTERKTNLEKAGYDYNAIQKEVNNLLNRKSTRQLAYEVIEGRWGYGADRKKRLDEAGYDYDSVQKLVNQILGY